MLKKSRGDTSLQSSPCLSDKLLYNDLTAMSLEWRIEFGHFLLSQNGFIAGEI